MNTATLKSETKRISVISLLWMIKKIVSFLKMYETNFRKEPLGMITITSLIIMAISIATGLTGWFSWKTCFVPFVAGFTGFFFGCFCINTLENAKERDKKLKTKETQRAESEKPFIEKIILILVVLALLKYLFH